MIFVETRRCVGVSTTIEWIVALRVLGVAAVATVPLGYFAVRFGLDGRLVPALVSGVAAAGSAAAGWWYLRRTLATAE